MKVSKFSKKVMPYLYNLCQVRYICYAMIHSIFMFMYLMLTLTKPIAYIFEKKLRDQSEES